MWQTFERRIKGKDQPSPLDNKHHVCAVKTIKLLTRLHLQNKKQQVLVSISNQLISIIFCNYELFFSLVVVVCSKATTRFTFLLSCSGLEHFPTFLLTILIDSIKPKFKLVWIQHQHIHQRSSDSYLCIVKHCVNVLSIFIWAYVFVLSNCFPLKRRIQHRNKHFRSLIGSPYFLVDERIGPMGALLFQDWDNVIGQSHLVHAEHTY